MTFYAVRRPDENRLVFSMNPLLRLSLLFMLFSVGLTFLFNFSVKDFALASRAGQISIILTPTLLFLGSFYRCSVSFDKRDESCIVRRGLIFLHKKESFSFDDLTALNYRVYEYHQEGTGRGLGIPRRSKADFGLYFKGKLFQLEKGASKRGTEALYLGFSTYFPKELRAE
ncbi:MAG: hypothetical protein PQJ59_00190 [Spirochaetales bacterium]|nr:hypothetical protein [Spirochaetales bacterium]